MLALLIYLPHVVQRLKERCTVSLEFFCFLGAF